MELPSWHAASFLESATKFDDGGDDTQARFVTAQLGTIQVVCVYVPNGKAPGTDKYAFKLEWMGRLRQFLERHHSPGDAIVLCGDFNVAPEDRDVHDPLLWQNEILCTNAERSALQNIVAFGFSDALRLHHPQDGLYTWWDYRMLGFPKNHGLRIDHIYVTRSLALSNAPTRLWTAMNGKVGCQAITHRCWQPSMSLDWYGGDDPVTIGRQSPTLVTAALPRNVVDFYQCSSSSRE